MYSFDGYRSDFEADNLSVTFSGLVFFSWIGTIKYLRIFEELRIFIEMLSNVVSHVGSFLMILAVGFFAVTNAYWFKYEIEEADTIADGTFPGYIKFLTIFYTFVLFGNTSK